MKTQTLSNGATRYIGLGVLSCSSLTLTRAATRSWEDSGEAGDRYRREARRTLAAIAGDHDLRTVTVYTHDGVTLEVYDFGADS
jgi:hypothetical protein